MTESLSVQAERRTLFIQRASPTLARPGWTGEGEDRGSQGCRATLNDPSQSLNTAPKEKPAVNDSIFTQSEINRFQCDRFTVTLLAGRIHRER